MNIVHHFEVNSYFKYAAIFEMTFLPIVLLSSVREPLLDISSEFDVVPSEEGLSLLLEEGQTLLNDGSETKKILNMSPHRLEKRKSRLTVLIERTKL